MKRNLSQPKVVSVIPLPGWFAFYGEHDGNIFKSQDDECFLIVYSDGESEIQSISVGDPHLERPQSADNFVAFQKNGIPTEDAMIFEWKALLDLKKGKSTTFKHRENAPKCASCVHLDLC